MTAGRASISNVRHLALVDEALDAIGRADAALEAGATEELVPWIHGSATGAEAIRGAARPRTCCTTSSRGFVSASSDSTSSIGAGHAIRGRLAAARLGCRVGLCTLSADTVALMPCNPAIGGTAKGHLVREIDAMGGLMGVPSMRPDPVQDAQSQPGPGGVVAESPGRQRRYGAVEALAEANITWLLRRAGARDCRTRPRDLVLRTAAGRCRALVVTTGRS
jgi:hypothetical protein